MPRRDFVKALAELTDGDDWKVADLIVKEYPEAEFGDGAHGENTGLYEELEATQTELAKEYGIELKASTLRNYRAAAIKWPDATRVASASFDAHRALRGADRFELMRVYLIKAKREGRKSLSRRAVMRYRAEDKPGKAAMPWEAVVAHAVDALARRLVLGNVKANRDDWWNATAATAARRRTVAKALRDVAGRLE